MQIVKAKLVSKRQVSRDVFDFICETEAPLPFKAGQFVSLRFPAEKPPFHRPYSVACRPHPPGDRHFQFCIKKIPSGPASTYLCELSEGAELEIKGPSGHFLADQQDVPFYYFITTGTGIAPLKAMIEDLLEVQGVKTPMFLVFGFRGEVDQFYTDWCREMKARFANFDYAITLSQPTPEWLGLRGRVTDYIIHHLQDPAEKHYYLCGVGEMIQDVRQHLESRGVSKDKIHYERFT